MNDELTGLEAELRGRFGSHAPGQQHDDDRPHRFAGIVALATTTKQRFSGFWRRHIVQETTTLPTEGHTRGLRRAAFAFLTLMLLAACIVAGLVLGQIKSLRFDIAMLQ